MVILADFWFVALLILSAVVLAGIVDAIRKVGKIQVIQDRMSFMESMNLVDLPVVTFLVKGGNQPIKLNFLLDTGSNKNHINQSLLPSIQYESSGKQEDIIGIEGNKAAYDIINMSVSYKDKEYSDEFTCTDLDEAFALVKAENGVQIHGILGSSFFQKYKYVLDFDELVAYTKI